MMRSKRSAFELAFHFRYYRWPQTESERKKLPMIYFQQQVKAKFAIRIQRWFRDVRVRKSLTCRGVRFDTFRSPEFFAGVAQSPYCSTNSKQTQLETEKTHATNEMKKFYLEFERDNGRAPGTKELRPVRGLHDRYINAKHEIAATKRSQVKSARRTVRSAQSHASRQSIRSSYERSFSVEARLDYSECSDELLLEEKREPVEPPFHFLSAVTQTGTHGSPVRKQSHHEDSFYTAFDTEKMAHSLEDTL